MEQTLPNLTVLYEDNQIIVVLKPQNVPSQADDSGDMDMLSMVKQYVKVKYNKAGNVFIGLVHRLDRPTGGVMVFARNSKSAERLSQSIIDGEFEKKYFAVVVGVPSEKQGRLVHYLQKNAKENIVQIVPQATENAKRAELDYKLVQSLNDTISLVEIKLLTGRSHQARVQMKSLGTPIFGDVKYGGDTLSKGHNLALWAYELRLPHPVTKQTMVFKIEPPTESVPWNNFKRVIDTKFR